MNIGKFWRNLTRVESIKTVGSKPTYVHLCDQISSNRAFLETINEMNQANWHHAINALNEMKLTINSFDSIIRNVDKRMGDAEIALGVKQKALKEKEKFLRGLMKKEMQKLNPNKRKKP